MKKNLLLVAGLMMAAAAVAQEATVLTPTKDTWLRYNNKIDHSTDATLEIGSTFTTDETTGETTYSKDFVGVMAFDAPTVPAGYEIDKATLRVTSERIKIDRSVTIYPFTTEFEATGIYENYTDQIAAARKETAVGTVSLEGYNNKSVTDDLSDSKYAKYQSIDKWQNTADITDYVKSVTTNQFAIMICATKSSTSTSNNKIFSSKATAVNNTKCDLFNSATAADLVPQITVTYKTTTGINTIDASADAADAPLYNAAGQQVGKSYKGLVIKNGKKFVQK